MFFSKHPQMSENGFNPETTHPRFGAYRRWGPLVTVNGPKESYGPGVLAGEHTDALLIELGIGAEERERLRASGVVASELA